MTEDVHHSSGEGTLGRKPAVTVPQLIDSILCLAFFLFLPGTWMTAKTPVWQKILIAVLDVALVILVFVLIRLYSRSRSEGRHAAASAKVWDMMSLWVEVFCMTWLYGSAIHLSVVMMIVFGLIIGVVGSLALMAVWRYSGEY